MPLADPNLRTILEPDGAYALPEAFKIAKGTVDALIERYAAVRRQMTDADRAANDRSGRSAELVDLAAAGSLPDSNHAVVAPLVAAENDRDIAASAATILAGARTLAEARLRQLVLHNADEFIVDHLRPAHAETINEARRLAPKLAGIRLDDPEEVWKAPPAIQAAYQDAKALADRYERIRDARHALGHLARRSNEFAEFREEHFGRWPKHPVARLLAVATSAIAWMPTFEEAREAQRVAKSRAESEVKAMRARGIPAESLTALGG